MSADSVSMESSNAPSWLLAGTGLGAATAGDSNASANSSAQVSLGAAEKIMKSPD